MNQQEKTPQPTLDAGAEAHGFRIDRVTPVPEIRAIAYEATHLATGARLLHLHCEDRENLYSVVFRTPPADNTGVAHILEHSVLAGSEHYPVRDAFNELGKGSLRTFLNAFTAPDSTFYPVASQVRADFYNLVSVYNDLVFRPLLSRNTFYQEGHHLEVAEDGSLTISGIVYNEMKGSYSSAENISERTTFQNLFPDTPYGVESGGHPEHIPELTHEQFREFHRRYYAPSNARIFLYGNIPTPDHLAFLEGQLAGFGRVEVDSKVAEQPRWREPRASSATFPAGKDDPVERAAIVNVAWLTAPIHDGRERLILEVLQEALVGNAAAPLRKALIDSGLGEDLSPVTGLHPWFRQLPFVVGLRGTDPDKAQEIERLALSTLARLADEGLPRDLLEAAFHQVEFHGLEITRSPMPFPLMLLLRSLGSWLHEHDPIPPLRLPAQIAELREHWAAHPDLFRDAVRRWFIDNPHRLLSVVTPSRTLAAEQERKVKDSLAARRAAMTPAELDEVRARAATLLEVQRAGDSPEALATLPKLQLKDIPPEVEIIPTEQRNLDGTLVLEHDIFSNGIAYLDVAFDVSDVPEELQPYLPVLGAAATGMGAAGLGYAGFATRKALVAGDLSCELRSRDRAHDEGSVQLLVLRARALARNAAPVAGLLRDIVTAGDLDDADRLRDILAEQRNGLRARVAPGGHMFAFRTASSGLSVSGWRDEQWHGLSQLRFLSELSRRYESEGAQIRDHLRRLREIVFRRGRAVLNLTGDSRCLEALRGPAGELAGSLPSGGAIAAPVVPFLPPVHVGVAVPGNVCYVARSLGAPRQLEPGCAPVLVVSNYLSDGIVYKKVRMEGGAYGGFSIFVPHSGVFGFASYRDPNLEKTLEVYDTAVDAFLEEELDPEAVRTTIIGTIGNLDRPLDPPGKGIVGMDWFLSGLTDADRQRFRESVLAVDARAMRAAAADILKPAARRAMEAVYAPRERLEAANRTLARPFDIVTLE